MNEENIMTIIFLSTIYGISVVLTFIMSLATAGVIGIKSKSLSILISIISGLMSPITILLFIIWYLFTILIEKVFILNDIYGVIMVVCFGLRVKDLPKNLERDELIETLDEILEKRKSSLNTFYF